MLERTRANRRRVLALPWLALTSFGAATALAQEGESAMGEGAAQEESPSAQDREYRFEFGLFGGGHYFTSEHGLGRFEDDPTGLSPKSGFLFGGRLTLNFNRYLAVEAEAALTPTESRDEATSMWVAGYRGSLLVNLIPRGWFRPFLLAGFGGQTSIVDDESVVGSDTDSALHAGIGAKFLFTDNFGLRIDGRIMAPPSFMADVVEIGSETGFGGPDFEGMLSLYYAFSEVPRPVIKKEVVVVKEPPPPNPDPDGDGIAGASDKCPEVAEDKDGFEDEDGCPEADNDGDGIPDLQDKCPLKPENKNDIDDDDGCPEEDTDGDGFLGSKDKCPDAPETKNNFQDNDGCPDEVPEQLKKFTGVIQGINFKTKSATILKGSYVILDRAVEVLKEYPDVKLEIQGHTDDRGKADFNRDLSQKRADAVKNYLETKGIAAGRLQAIGYGEDQPIDTNKTERGRSRNRRTEFKLLSN